MQTICNTEKAFICKCLADKRDAEGEVIRFEARGKGNSGEIEQVDEVSVVAEVCVELDRRGFNLFDGVMRGCSGQQQKIRLLPDDGGFPAQGFKRIGGIEGFDCGVLCRAANNVADCGVNCVWIGCEEVFERCKTLGDPWAFVEQAGGVAEWGVVEFDGLAAKCCERIDRGFI